ncbi:hypothetical protein LTR56_010573 [Elasticomyces elasticus]|nr:hypothetical protein LTR56_010573 [Elasticomyces elasticus]KAK3648688.1 hypothetical protein LTR22_013324 [Elasticomyces elasticus]KAK4932429.1 hypothetical protein LTR49_001298 [Elasticomyces elasticus]KAK5760130.1 hypothetical protein LTS12_009685 [Elasticomyces elasticus]
MSEKADSIRAEKVNHGVSPSPPNEKDIGHVAKVKGLDALPDPDAGCSDEERRRIDKALVRSLDLKLIPWLTLLYLVSFLDRTNIGNAKIDGLLEDLHMTGGQYNACLSLFFVSYAGFEPLTNILLKRLRPSVFLPIIMVLWGITMTCMGLVHDFSGLAAARFFLGVAEAGLFPGVNYYLSCWYKRSEIGIRAAIFFSAAALAGSFGGLLAAAIAKMDGVGGKHGWCWIFILEGLVTVLIGLASYWFVHDFPDDAKFLSDVDRQRVIRRLKADAQSSAEHEEFKMSYFWASFKDWKTWSFAVIYMGCDGALYAFSLFLPTIISQLGYTATTANLLSVPPYAAAAVLTIFIGWLADRTAQRGWCNVGVSLLGIMGFSMLLGSTSPGVKYAGTFFGALGIYPCVANTIVWAANNTEGVYKRGVTLGFVIGWGNLNGVVSSNIYRAKDKPNYKLGHAVVLAYMICFLLGGSLFTHFALISENKKKLAGKSDHLIEGKSDEEVELLGDKSTKRTGISLTVTQSGEVTDVVCKAQQKQPCKMAVGNLITAGCHLPVEHFRTTLIMSEDTPTKQRTPGTSGIVQSPHSGTSKVPHINQDGASASQPRGHLTIPSLLFLICAIAALTVVIFATLPARTDDNERVHHGTLQENITFMQLARRRNDDLQWATLISNFSAEKCAALCNTGYADCVESTHVTCPSEYCLLWRSLNYEMAKELRPYDGVFVPVRYELNTYPSASGSPEWSDPSVKEFMCPQRLEAPAPIQSIVTTTVAASTITEFSSSTTTVYETVTPALDSRQSTRYDVYLKHGQRAFLTYDEHSGTYQVAVQ